MNNMKRILLLTALSLGVFTVQAQKKTGSIEGTITNETTQSVVISAKIQILRSDSSIYNQTFSNIEGKYRLDHIDPGVYIFKVIVNSNIISLVDSTEIKANETTLMNVAWRPLKKIKKQEYALKLEEIQIQDAEIVEYKELKMEVSEMKMEVHALEKRVERVQTLSVSNDAMRSQSVSPRTKGIRGNDLSLSRQHTEHNTESYNKIDDNPYKNVATSPLSTMSIDVDRAAYSNVRRYITKGSLPPAGAVRIEEMINYFSYDYPSPKGNNPFSITTEYTDCPWNKDHKLVHIGLKGMEVEMLNAPANNLVFLIDVSGSMNSSDKLQLLKSGLYLLVDQLRDEDKVAIVVYAGSAGLVLPSTNGNEKDKIKDVIEQLRSGGSTAGGAGIKLAYKIALENYMEGGNNRVILATDGDFNIGVSSDADMISLIEEKRNDNIFLSVLGFGTGNLKDSKMEQVADKGNGNYSYIDNILEAKKVLVKEFGGTLITIAKDVKVQAEFNPAHVKGYRLVGYVNRQMANEDFNDDTKDAGELGSGHTVTVLYEIIPAGSSETIGSIDSLKYQNALTPDVSDKTQNEILTVKFRYKKPKEDESTLMTHVLIDEKTPFRNVSNNCQFASAVAAFGMLLRDSEFKGDASYQSVIKQARDSKGQDHDGYRAEFIRLVEMAELIKGTDD
jgi:Ca-activated chloride channel homolog